MPSFRRSPNVPLHLNAVSRTSYKRYSLDNNFTAHHERLKHAEGDGAFSDQPPSLVDTFTFEPLSITDDSSSSDNHPVQEQTSNLHIVFVVDTTGSMNVFLQALKESLHQINALLRVLFPESSDISVLTYKDYCQYPRKEVMRCKIQGSYAELSEFCATLSATGGGDLAEASKTAFNQVSRLARN